MRAKARKFNANSLLTFQFIQIDNFAFLQNSQVQSFLVGMKQLFHHRSGYRPEFSRGEQGFTQFHDFPTQSIASLVRLAQQTNMRHR